MSAPASYAFGDSALAARRLERLCAVFAGPMRDFLRAAVRDRPESVVDLGCGPGCTTHLLAETLTCGQVIGIDNSAAFIAMARRNATERVSFVHHDFTAIPFPVGPADLLFARFALTHVSEPAAIVSRWADPLRPGGLLLLQETEWIETDVPPFSTYLAMVSKLLAHQSHCLYVGPNLGEIGDTDRLERRSSGVRRFQAPPRDAAGLFSMNLQTWKHHPYIQAHYPAGTLDCLERELADLAQSAGDETAIEWGLREMVFARR